MYAISDSACRTPKSATQQGEPKASPGVEKVFVPQFTRLGDVHKVQGGQPAVVVHCPAPDAGSTDTKGERAQEQ
jgi:hypothetical protein